MGIFDFFKKESWVDRLKNQLSTYEGCIEYLNNSRLQNDLLDPRSRKAFLKESVWPGRDGFPERFGYHPEYPIKVNGPIGEITYLSALVTITGRHLLFHRLGPVVVMAGHPIDLFECMATDGSAWLLLFMDPYFMQKSEQIPSGLSRSPYGCKYIMGTCETVSGFPDTMRRVLERENSYYVWKDEEIEELRYCRYELVERPADYARYARDLCFRINEGARARAQGIYGSIGQAEFWSRDFRSSGLFENKPKNPG